MAENTIDNLSIQVAASAENAVRVFDRLTSGMGRVRNAASGAAGAMRDTANAAGDMANAAEDAGTATANAGTQTGYAESHIRRFARALMTTSSQTIGRFITAVNRGASAVGGFIRQIARVLMYRSIRSMIKDIGQSFRDLYGWSRMFGTDFAKSMDRINTSAVYLRNSFAAMVAPVINALAPAIDVIADKIVDIFNFVNQIFAALSGAETYTVAKKVAQTWESTFDSASSKAKKTVKEIRNTLLGFDEINRLNGNTPTSTGSTGSSPYTPGYNSMFEEKPLEGFFKKISDMPDWLKWLFGGVALVGGFLLIRKFIPWLLKKLGELFSLKIPNWLKWLFGPKGDGDNGLNIPDKIDLPDGNIDVNLKKGDWSALDDVPKTLYMSPKLDNKPEVLFDNFRDDWNDIPGRTLYLSPKLDNTAKTLYNAFKKEWDGSGSKVLYFSPKFDNKSSVLYDSFIKGWDEVGSTSLYFSPKLDNTAKTLYLNFKKDWDSSGSKTLYFSPKLDNGADTLYASFKKEWDNAGSKTLYVSPKLDNKASVLWNELKEAWNELIRTLYVSPKLDNTAAVLFNKFKAEWNKIESRSLYMSPKFDNTAGVLWNQFKAAWDAAAQTLKVAVELDYGDSLSGGTTGFGGATGGGGTNNGSGAGRGRHDTTMNVTVNATAGTGFSGIDKDGNMALRGIGPASATINGTPGNGFASKLSGTNTYTLKGIEAANTTVNAKAGTGFNGILSNGLFALRGIGAVAASVTAALNKSASNDAAVNALTTGSYNKNVNMAFKVTGMDSSYGSDISVDDSGVTGATSSITDLLTAFNKLKSGLTKKLGISITQDGTTPTEVNTALTFKSGLKKAVKVEVAKAGSINGTVGNALDAPAENYKAINVALGADSKNSDSTAVKAVQNIGKKVSISISTVVTSLKGATTAIADFFGIGKKAMGGIFSNGVWSNIPQYAGGTLNAHGSLFMAGEAGPEIVGHIGGRTEVLNKSQIASAMYSAVRNAMSGITLDANIYNSGNAEFDYDAMYQAMYDAFTAALSRNDERDREKLALMREIAAKDFNPEITTTSINKAQTRMNRRAGTTIVSVGT